MQYLTTLANDLKKYIHLDEKVVTSVFFALVSAIFLYGTFRMLYQWLVSNGFEFAPFLAKILLIKSVMPVSPSFEKDKQALKQRLKTTLIICAVILASRIFIYLYSYYFRLQHDMHYGTKPYGFFAGFIKTWNQWDAPHYLDVAREWYVGDMEYHNHLFIVFYPLYPLLMHISGIFAPDFLYPTFSWSTLTSPVFHNTGAFFFYSGCVISVLCLMIGGVYFYKLALKEYNKKIAIWAMAFLLLNPASFFLNSVYTESVFLMLTIMFFYYLRKSNYIIAAIAGAFAAFSKSLGVLLVVPFFVEWVDQEQIFLKFRSKRIKEIGKSLVKKGLPVVIIPLGTVAYLLINYFTFGDALKFLDIQSEHWGQNFMFFLENIANLGARIFFYDVNYIWEIWAPGFIMIVIALVAFMMGSGKKLRTSYLAYMFIYIIIGAAPSWLLSGARYFAMLFPIYFILAEGADKNKKWGIFMLILSFAAMMYLLSLHITGQQVM